LHLYRSLKESPTAKYAPGYSRPVQIAAPPDPNFPPLPFFHTEKHFWPLVARNVPRTFTVRATHRSSLLPPAFPSVIDSPSNVDLQLCQSPPSEIDSFARAGIVSPFLRPLSPSPKSTHTPQIAGPAVAVSLEGLGSTRARQICLSGTLSCLLWRRCHDRNKPRYSDLMTL